MKQNWRFYLNIGLHRRDRYHWLPKGELQFIVFIIVMYRILVLSYLIIEVFLRGP